VSAPAATDVVLAGPATTPGPVAPAAPTGLPATSVPASSAGPGSSSGDQTPADLSSAPWTALGAVLVAVPGTGSRPARPAVLEPSFSPD